MAKIERHMTRASRHLDLFAESAGKVLVRGFHLLALFAIGASVVWAAAYDFIDMANKGSATVEDILLLFIYLELGAMVGIYFQTNRMPSRFLIYVAMTALTRMLVGFINVEHIPDMRILYVAGAILLLALSVLVLRYGSFKLPADPGRQESSDFAEAEKTV